MDKNQQESRRSATQEFISSLDTLKAVLHSDSDDSDAVEHVSPQPAAVESASLNSASLPPPLQRPSPEFPPEADLETLLDDVLQDIEQFMSEHPSE